MTMAATSPPPSDSEGAGNNDPMVGQLKEQVEAQGRRMQEMMDNMSSLLHAESGSRNQEESGGAGRGAASSGVSGIGETSQLWTRRELPPRGASE